MKVSTDNHVQYNVVIIVNYYLFKVLSENNVNLKKCL